MSYDYDPEFLELYDQCKSETMTSVERMYALYKSIVYINENKIAGDIVECGVWRGGSMMLAALTLQNLGVCDRRLYLFDTFEGMPSPGESDVQAETGISAEDLLSKEEKYEDSHMWAIASYDLVSNNMSSTGYPLNRVRLIKGKVEDTLPHREIRQIALLRLDTDWYSSTRHELKTLYPLLSTSGILIIDDYGYWKGSRKATDEYLAGKRVFLSRIDETGRVAVKPPRRIWLKAFS